MKILFKLVFLDLRAVAEQSLRRGVLYKYGDVDFVPRAGDTVETCVEPVVVKSAQHCPWDDTPTVVELLTDIRSYDSFADSLVWHLSGVKGKDKPQ